MKLEDMIPDSYKARLWTTFSNFVIVQGKDLEADTPEAAEAIADAHNKSVVAMYDQSLQPKVLIVDHISTLNMGGK